jgi:hypothetical protein
MECSANYMIPYIPNSHISARQLGTYLVMLIKFTTSESSPR